MMSLLHLCLFHLKVIESSIDNEVQFRSVCCLNVSLEEGFYLCDFKSSGDVELGSTVDLRVDPCKLGNYLDRNYCRIVRTRRRGG